MSLAANLIIGIISGIAASVLTLWADRWRHNHEVEQRLRSIAGDYLITGNSAGRDTSKESLTIKHASGRRFNISAKGGPTGNWEGFFIVREDFFDVAHGIYRYPNQADWGHHEYLFDEGGQIFVYGTNRSKPGFMEPFSFTLQRKPEHTEVSAVSPNAA